MIVTKSGKYVIFDVTDPSFCPGKKIPPDFDATNGVWFFQPADWSAPNWGGIKFAELRGFPFAYSPSFPTPEAALKAAEEWEIEEPLLDTINLQKQLCVSGSSRSRRKYGCPCCRKLSSLNHFKKFARHVAKVKFRAETRRIIKAVD